MGYIDSSTTLNLVAKLTPIGRQLLANNSISTLITKFAFGDDDANYYTSGTLASGEVPTQSGLLTVSADSLSNSTYYNITQRSFLIKDDLGAIYKTIDSSSSNLNTTNSYLGTNIVSSTGLTFSLIDRTNTTASTTNLFYSLGLPITTTDKATYSALTSANGGYSDTAVSGISQDVVLLIAIANAQYGECIDGKTIKLDLTTSANTYNIYGTYRDGLQTVATQDGQYRETSTDFINIGNNIVFLFSDTIQKPNNDSTKSWSTMWNTYKPFTNGKSLFNYKTNVNLSKVVDIPVGICYLDKGIIAITNPTLVNSFDITTGVTATTLTFNSVITTVQQNITCLKSRGEFGKSNNKTFTVNVDTPRVSSVGLYDNNNNLIAIAKLDRHVECSMNTFMALNIAIKL